MGGKRSSNNVLIVVGIAATMGTLAFFFWYLPRFRDAILPGLNSIRTTSAAIIDVTLRDTEREGELNLRIPQAYMVRAQEMRGGVLETLSLETRLPDLAAAPALPKVEGDPVSPEYQRALVEFNNGIAIYLTNAYVDSDWTLGRPRRNWLAALSADRNSGRAIAYDLIDDDYAGLLFYKQVTCSAPEPGAGVAAGEPNCLDAYREHYLSKDEARPTVYVVCEVWDLPTLTYRLGCTAATTYRGFQVTYVLRHSQLSRWPEFDSGVRQLLDGFVTDNSAQ